MHTKRCPVCDEQTFGHHPGSYWRCSSCGYRAHVMGCFDGEGLRACYCGLGPDFYQDPMALRRARGER